MKIIRNQKVALAAFGVFMNSCITEQVEPSVDCNISPLVVTISEVNNASCGLSDGSFSIEVSGGEAPYDFNSDLGSNTNGTFTSVTAGNYSVTIADFQGCTEEIAVSVQNENGVNLGEIVTSEAGCGAGQGSIEVTASDGVEPYSYSLNGSSAQSSNTFSGLDHGNYSVSVIDADGCETSQNVNVLSGISFENSVKSIIETDCAISGCHNGSVSPDLRTFNSIQSNASRIKSETEAGSMPRDRTLTQTQIDLIACWVDDGALNN